MKVVESFTRSKRGSDDGGDDRIVVTDHFAAVLDGATSSFEVAGISSGRFAANVGAKTIANLPKEVSLEDAVERLSAALAREFEQNNSHRATRKPSFAVVLYSFHRQEIWRVADCQYLIDGKGENSGIQVDEITARTRALITRGLLVRGHSVEELRRTDPGNEALAPLFKSQFALINHSTDPLAYGVINGNPVPKRFLEVIPVPTDASSVVLASDGYPVLLPTLAESEASLATIREQDPLLIETHLSNRGIAPEQEWYDDRTYLRLQLNPIVE